MTPQPGFDPHVTRLGHGARQVLALHCTMAFSGAWAALAQRVGDDITLIAPDMPSHGQSQDWDGTSSFAETVYQATLSCLSAPTDIIGHSFGGATALRLAVERPDLVRSVTLIEPVFFCVGADFDPRSMEDHDEKALPFFTAFEQGDIETAARAFNRMWSVDGPPWADLPGALRAAMMRAIPVVPDTVPFLYEDCFGLRNRMGQADVPILLLHGEHTLDIVKSTNQGLAQLLPRADQAEVSGAGHMAPITHPTETAGLWLDWLQAQDQK